MLKQPGILSYDEKKMKEQILQAYDSALVGLPYDVFEYITSITPMINVDLLVRDNAGRILLAWREDSRSSGWHIPGGIIRYKETVSKRIAKTAQKELGCNVVHSDYPIKISEIIESQRKRGHFISLLFECGLPDGYDIEKMNYGKTEMTEGYLKWFDRSPDRIVFGQVEAYSQYIKQLLEKR